eukprot:SAG11_NODE_68_length_18649_cov_29.058005_12_plen_118_part_00
MQRCDPLWCVALMRQQNTSSEDNNDKVYYNVLLPDLLLAPLENADDVDESEDGDYAKLQRAGTCYFKCVAAGMVSAAGRSASGQTRAGCSTVPTCSTPVAAVTAFSLLVSQACRPRR